MVRIAVSVLAGLFLSIVFLGCAKAPATPTPTPTPIPIPTPTQQPSSEFVPQPVVLPRDDAPHDGVDTEWWYYSGHLTEESGNRYDFHYVIFQVSPPDLPAVNIGHLAITDLEKGTYVTAQRFLPTLLAARNSTGFAFDMGDWQMSGHDGKDRLTVSTDNYAFDVTVTSQKAPVLHGTLGFVDFETAGGSYYYSRTRMDAVGAITIDELETAVTGAAWFDHQWGNFDPTDIGWDWFAIQLDDGTDVMLTLLRDSEQRPLYQYGTHISADGKSSNIPGNAMEVVSIGSWASPTSGAVYPMGWTVAIPSHGINVAVAPLLERSEFNATLTTQNYYWEGGVDVSGTHQGKGFVEMTKYE